MPTGSGLDGQLGTKTEVTPGTVLTPDHWFNFDSADISFAPSYIEGQGIRAGKYFKSVNQAGIARKAAAGKIELPMMYKGMSWWIQHMMGSTQTLAVVPTGTLAFEAYFTPSGLRGKSFSTQVGTPDPNTGTVVPMNFNGCKITDWELAFADNANTLLTLTVDAWNVNATAPTLGVATYITNNQLHNFSNVSTFTLGGTASTAAGKTTIAAGVNVASVVSSLTIVGKNTLATDRFGLGNAGLKKEQLETDFTAITGTFAAEYNEAEFQTPFRVGTTTAIQIGSFSTNFIESSTAYQVSVIMPACKITKAAPTVAGPGIVAVSGEFVVYDPDDGTNPPIQIHIVSTDTVL
jgi:hypothetical protein